jgi:dihydropyrimidinase
VHGENGDAIFVAQKRTFDAGISGPEGHAISRPAILEVKLAAALFRA